MNASTDIKYLLSLDDRYTVESGGIYLNGMQALLPASFPAIPARRWAAWTTDADQQEAP